MPVLIFPPFLKQGFFTPALAKAAGLQAPGETPVCLPSPCRWAGMAGTCAAAFGFMLVLGLHTQVVKLAWLNSPQTRNMYFLMMFDS